MFADGSGRDAGKRRVAPPWCVVPLHATAPHNIALMPRCRTQTHYCRLVYPARRRPLPVRGGGLAPRETAYLIHRP